MIYSGILCLYKPRGITSFDAVNQVKRKFMVKTGHSGTLDPEAEGVLVVAVNNATKALPYLDVKDKVYHATLTLGIRTDTGDIWGNAVEECTVPVFDELKLIQIFESMIGKMSQRVPVVSAKKIKGKKLYEYHRAQEAVPTVYTDIEIYSLKLESWSETHIQFSAHVSNGTYIRTLCEDIAEHLGTVGTMSSLVRLHVGSFSVEQSHKIDDISDLESVLLPVKCNIALPHVVDAHYRLPILHGKRFNLPTDEDLVLVDAGDVFAVCERTEDGDFKVKRGLW